MALLARRAVIPELSVDVEFIGDCAVLSQSGVLDDIDTPFIVALSGPEIRAFVKLAQQRGARRMTREPAKTTPAQAERGIIATAYDAMRMGEGAQCDKCGRILPLYRIRTNDGGIGPKVILAHGSAASGFCSSGRGWCAL